MSADLIKDLSTITTIPENSLIRLCDKSMECIGHTFYENIIDGESITKIDTPIGCLYIIYEGDEISYKFIPSDNMEDMLVAVTNNRYSPLTKNVEEVLVNKIMNVYKELI